MMLSGISNMYWITRLSLIHDAFSFTFIVSLIAAVILGIVILIFGYGEEYCIENYYIWLKNTKKYFVTALSVIVFSGIILTFVPKTNEVLLIYGIGTTIDYIDDNDTIKQLPDKAVQALDKYLDTLNEDNKNESD